MKEKTHTENKIKNKKRTEISHCLDHSFCFSDFLLKNFTKFFSFVDFLKNLIFNDVFFFF